MTIEELWQQLRVSASNTQRRIDAAHPLDIYVDFELPNRPGLVVVCGERPPMVRPLKAVAVEEGRRADGRWSLRLSLNEPSLLPVFSALCNDVIEFTRSDVSEAQLSAAVIRRLDHWRNLFERDGSGLTDAELRGMIGELTVLDRVLDLVEPLAAIASWTGPLRTPQDFILPSGRRIEVKAANKATTTVRINGLGQLDAGIDGLDLVVVRLEDTGSAAQNAITAPIMVDRIANRISGDPEALMAFTTSLAFLGWQEHPRHHSLIVRLVSVDRFVVGDSFPRMTQATVPVGVNNADYTITLPQLTGPSSEAFQ